MVPVISIEGTAMGTDERRGHGVFKRAVQAMEQLKQKDLFFGTSITVTTENIAQITSLEFITQLRDFGCKIVFFIEYVPTEPGTEHLAFRDEHVRQIEDTIEQWRRQFENIIFFSFPGDEKYVGGCLASGRGFFHIGPDGSAEPCPFSPFSDSNVVEMGLRGALQSPLFRRIRDAHALGWEHTGGCTLFEHRDEIEKMMSEQQKNKTTKKLSYDITYCDEALYEDKLSVVFDDLPAARVTQNRIREFVRNLPDDWRCPRCKQSKEKFNKA